MIGWLPCLRWGADRWWLPLSAASAQVLGSCFVAYGQSRAVDGPTRRAIVSCLHQDPPLLIYAALHQVGESTSPEQLADWLCARAIDHFADGDASLGCPPLPARDSLRWRELDAFFQTLPWTRWLSEAALYLEATGPAVPEAWREQWPQLVEEASEDVGQSLSQPSTALQQLARFSKQHRSLEASFHDQLQHAKLASLKQLAYGLSHEINNPLANVSTRAQQLQRGETDPNRQSILQRIIDQAYRAHEMIADLMFYASPPLPERQRMDLRETVERVVTSFAEQSRRHSVRLKLELPDHPIPVEADETMVGEAVRALIRNSLEAIGCEGTIVVSVVDHQDRSLVHVADSGPGLSEEGRRHAFDPYYSGREAGRGLGLGLCRAYRIVRLHEGDISVAGGPAGCVATISLPKVE